MALEILDFEDGMLEDKECCECCEVTAYLAVTPGNNCQQSGWLEKPLTKLVYLTAQLVSRLTRSLFIHIHEYLRIFTPIVAIDNMMPS